MKKTVLITGASRGIGRKTAAVFAENGYNVVINYNKNETAALQLLDKLKEIGSNAIAVKADVADENEVRKMFNSVFECFPSLDVLVNNAGIALPQKLLIDCSAEEINDVINVNLLGTINCSRLAYRKMVNQKRGKIINVSSVWGMCGGSCEVIYSASKSAVIGFTKALAKELAPSGITVNCVAPGVIGTDMNAHLDKDAIAELKEETPLMRIGTTKDVADSIFFLASEKSDFITGQVLSPNGGFVI